MLKPTASKYNYLSQSYNLTLKEDFKPKMFYKSLSLSSFTLFGHYSVYITIYSLLNYSITRL